MTTVFNNDTNNSVGQGTGTQAEYTETSLGKDIPFPAVSARYARLWSNGNTVNAYNHYVEVQVFGTGGTYAYSQSAYYAYSQSAYYAYSQSSYYAYSQAAYTVGNAIPATLFGSTFLGISNYTNNASNIPIGN